MKKEMLSRAMPRADRRVRTPRSRPTAQASSMNGSAHPKPIASGARQYVEIVDHGDRVVLDIDQFSNGGNKKGRGQDQAEDERHLPVFEVFISNDGGGAC